MKKVANIIALSLVLAYSGSSNADVLATWRRGSGPIGDGNGSLLIHNVSTERNFWAYCIEADYLYSNNQNYIASNWSTDLKLSPIQKDQLDRLVSQSYEAAINDASDDSRFNIGLQLAIWEIVHDQPLRGPNYLSTGLFPNAYPDIVDKYWVLPDYVNVANEMLSTLSSAPTGKFQLTYWRSDLSQDLLEISAVPEPHTYALLVAGLFLVFGSASVRPRAKAILQSKTG